MKNRKALASALVLAGAAVLCGWAASAQDKYTVKVTNGLAFSEFRGYENWQLVSISQDGPRVAAILGNPTMIRAYQSGIPGNGQAFPDGAKLAKIHWKPQKMETFPAATVPGAQANDAKCGFACHSTVTTRDYVFTNYSHR